MKLFLSFIILTLGCSLSMYAQRAEDLVSWDIKISKTDKKNEYIISATAQIEPTWHLFGQKPGDEFLIPTHFEFENKKIELIKVDELGQLKTEDMKGVGTIHYYEKKVSFNALVRSIDNDIKGFIEFQICNATMCLPPTQKDFSFTVK